MRPSPQRFIIRRQQHGNVAFQHFGCGRIARGSRNSYQWQPCLLHQYAEIAFIAGKHAGLSAAIASSAARDTPTNICRRNRVYVRARSAQFDEGRPQSSSPRCGRLSLEIVSVADNNPSGRETAFCPRAALQSKIGAGWSGLAADADYSARRPVSPSSSIKGVASMLELIFGVYTVYGRILSEQTP